MELKFVIPNMEKTFGNLEFAGEDKTEQKRINGRMAVLSRSFNLYSDVQRADDIVVILPAEAGEKHKNVHRAHRIPHGNVQLGIILESAVIIEKVTIDHDQNRNAHELGLIAADPLIPIHKNHIWKILQR